eukprot:GHRR01037618.1.p1 GENE.GHRR01037618.1~~GHRR01037618.1.p1  ORF type:complete len:142 (-),score=38.30 GHRR01037618.1:368-793(-)
MVCMSGASLCMAALLLVIYCYRLMKRSSLCCLLVQIFDLANNMGFDMRLLDIGGGFTGHFDSCGNVIFGDIATTINGALAAHFPPESGVQVIAEPGRYFAETAATLLTPIYGTRDRTDSANAIKKDYWITDGLYGSFNCIL